MVYDFIVFKNSAILYKIPEELVRRIHRTLLQEVEEEWAKIDRADKEKAGKEMNGIQETKVDSNVTAVYAAPVLRKKNTLNKE